MGNAYIRVPCCRIIHVGEEYGKVVKNPFQKQEGNNQQVDSGCDLNYETAYPYSRDQPVELTSYTEHIKTNTAQIPNQDDSDL